MTGCRPADTPMKFNAKLENPGDKVHVDREKYHGLVGKLIYLSHPRPDISYAVSTGSQFIYAPYEEHIPLDLDTVLQLRSFPLSVERTAASILSVLSSMVS